MRRKNLDACWGTEPSKMGVNLGSLRIIRRYALEGKYFFIPLTQLGLFPLEYLLGMTPEVLVSQWSLKPGIYKDYMQWDSTRSYSSAYGNILSTGVLGLGSYTPSIID